MRFHLRLGIVAVLFTAALLAACGGTPGPGTTITNLSYTDATHTTVTLTKQPKRIVCLVSLCEDILASLDIQPVAVNDTLSQDPHFFGSAAKSIPMIGGQFFSPNIEDIAKATPDLVIGLGGVHDQLRDALKPIAPLYIMLPSSYNDSIMYLKDIGRLTGHTAQADAAAQKFLHKLASYEAKSPKTTSTLLMYGSDVNFNIFTQGSLFGGVLAQVTSYPWPAPSANAAPASDHEAGAEAFSVERILAQNPDTLLIASFGGPQPLSKQLAANPAWSQLKAVQGGRVYEVNPSYYIFGRGTISLGLALDDAMMKLYPSVFPQPLD